MKNFNFKFVLIALFVVIPIIYANAQNTSAFYGTNSTSGTGLTGVGYFSLFNQAGAYNSALGYNSLAGLTGGTGNTGVGASALTTLTGGIGNTACGAGALNTLGSSPSLSGNSAFGYNALGAYGATGTTSDAFGYDALYSATSGSNDAFGAQSLYSLNGGNGNVAVGTGSLYSNVSGNNNTAVGIQTATFNTGYSNTCVGNSALFGAIPPAVCSGGFNTAIGFEALEVNTTGATNTAIGEQSLIANTTGDNNDALGAFALSSNVGGSANVAIGESSLLLFNSSGSNYNTALGNSAGSGFGSYTDCTFLGAQADASGNTQTNATALGFGATAASNEVALGNGSVTEIFALNATHTTWSDKRFKSNITEDVKGLEFIKKLRPVVYNFEAKRADEFRLKNKPDSVRNKIINSLDYGPATAIRQSGFIAQEVAEAAKEVGYDFNGVVVPKTDDEAYRLAYAQFVVPLVKGMQEQQQMIEAQAAQLQALTNQLHDLQDCCYGSGEDKSLTKPGSDKAALLYAAPNPTANATTIYYFAPQTSKTVRIEIKNEQGASIQTMPATNTGYSSVNIETSNLASGVYYYSLIVDDQITDTKKLVVTLK